MILRTRQPRPGTPLAAGSTLRRGLVGFVDLRDGFDRIARDARWTINPPAFTAGIVGADGVVQSDAGRYDTTPRENWRVAAFPLSFMAVWAPSAYIGATGWRLAVYGTLQIGEHFASGDYYAQVVTGGTSYTWDPGGSWPLQQVHRALVVCDGATARVFVNGFEVASGACTGALAYEAFGFSTVQCAGLGSFGYVAKWNRALSTDEALSITRNPWQIYTPRTSPALGAGFPALPIVTADPTPQTAEDGDTATYSVTATGATGYQWQRQEPLGGAWASVAGGSGATTASYTTPALARADAGALYRCVVSNADGSTTSGSALLQVTQVPTSYAGSVGQVIGSALSWVGHSYVGANDAAPGAFVAAFAARANTVISGGRP